MVPGMSTQAHLTAEQHRRVAATLLEETTAAKTSLAAARKNLKKIDADYAAAEKLERKTWAAHQKSPRSAKAKEAWEKAHKAFERVASTRFGVFDHAARLEKKVASLTDPATLQARLDKRASDNEYFGKLKDRTGTSSSGNQTKGTNMARTTLTAIEAVLKVLKDNGSPMKMPDIIEKAVPLTALSGANPGQTIYSVVYSEAKKDNSRVKQVDRGTFALASSRSRAVPAAAASGQSRKKTSSASSATKKASSTRKKTSSRSSGRKKTAAASRAR